MPKRKALPPARGVVLTPTVEGRKRPTAVKIKSPRDVCRALMRAAQILLRRPYTNPFEAMAAASACDSLMNAAEVVGGPRCKEEVALSCMAAHPLKREIARGMGPMRRARRAAAPEAVKHLFGLRTVRARNPCTPWVADAKRLRRAGLVRVCYGTVRAARAAAGAACARKVEFACHPPRRGPGRPRLYRS